MHAEAELMSGILMLYGQKIFPPVSVNCLINRMRDKNITITLNKSLFQSLRNRQKYLTCNTFMLYDIKA